VRKGLSSLSVKVPCRFVLRSSGSSYAGEIAAVHHRPRSAASSKLAAVAGSRSNGPDLIRPRVKPGMYWLVAHVLLTRPPIFVDLHVGPSTVKNPYSLVLSLCLSTYTLFSAYLLRSSSVFSIIYIHVFVSMSRLV
jgi:hypothetical protein